jgi:ribonuclease BN (tRNA processing enzyme)
MRVRILGAHNTEARDNKCTSLLIDDVLAIDAGSLTSSLSLTSQQKLQAILLTHQHYDHIRDIPAFGMNLFLQERTIDLYTTRQVQETLNAYLLNDQLYPNFMQKPPDKPVFRFHELEPGREAEISGYRVLPVAVNHAVPTVGYQIISGNGQSLFYSSDTGPGLTEVWQQISPQLIMIEVTAPNRFEAFARNSGHLTPGLLLEELRSFITLKGYKPKVIILHINPLEEATIQTEISEVARTLNLKIRLGHEGMLLKL